MNTIKKFNITKGWYMPHVVDPVRRFSGNDTAGAVSAGVKLEEGMIGRFDANNEWELGLAVSNPAQIPFLFRQHEDDLDTSPGGNTGVNGTVPVGGSGIAGLALDSQALVIENAQISGAQGGYTVGVELSVVASGANAGKLKVAVATEMVIGIVTKAPFVRGDLTFVEFQTVSRYIKQ